LYAFYIHSSSNAPYPWPFAGDAPRKRKTGAAWKHMATGNDVATSYCQWQIMMVNDGKWWLMMVNDGQ
jgi:hypothetical protein